MSNAAAVARWRANHPDFARLQQRRFRADPSSLVNRKRAVNKFLFDVLRAVPCADCGGRFPACAVDMDHRPGETKATEVSVLAAGNYYPSQLLAEVAKCDRVCSNCHRVRTRERSDYIV